MAVKNIAASVLTRLKLDMISLTSRIAQPPDNKEKTRILA